MSDGHDPLSETLSASVLHKMKLAPPPPEAPVAEEEENERREVVALSAQECYNSIIGWYLILDTRQAERFQTAHMYQAVNIDCSAADFFTGDPEAVMTKINSMISERRRNWESGRLISCIVYDDGEPDGNAVRMANFLAEFSIFGPVFRLSVSFDEFNQGYPFMNFAASSDPVIRRPFPSQILASNLYLGSVGTSANKEAIQCLQITHILNTARECQIGSIPGVTYHKMNWEDHPDFEILPEIRQAVDFIRDATQGGGKVLVHCAMGVSRSASAVIAFLMETNRTGLAETFQYVRHRRPMISPNRGFMRQLLAFSNDTLGLSALNQNEETTALMQYNLF